MESPEGTDQDTTTEGTADETAREPDEGSATVMPDKEAEDQPREPSEPPPGAGPGGG